MPSVKSFETDMRRARRKKRAKRTVKNLSFIMAVLIIFGLVYLSRDAWIVFFDGILDRHQATVQNDGLLAGGNFPIDISKKIHTKIGSISKDWTLFADTTFYVYNSSGDIIYSEQAPYSNPVVCEAGKRALVYDQGGYSFTVCGPRNKIYSKRMSNQILLGAVGSDGNVAIVTADDKYVSYLTIFDKGGSEIYHWADGTMITAVALSSNGKNCLVSCSYAREGSFKSVVTEIGFNSTEANMQTAPLETLGFSVEYCDGGFWLLGRDKLYRLDSAGGILSSLEYDFELSDYDLGEKMAALVFETTEGNSAAVTIIPAQDAASSSASVSGGISECVVGDKAVYILTSDAVNAYDVSGNLLATAPLSMAYRSLAVVGDEVFLLGYRSVEKIDFSI